MIMDNSKLKAELIAEGFFQNDRIVKNNSIFEQIFQTYNNVG
jgi:hypothetical protein